MQSIEDYERTEETLALLKILALGRKQVAIVTEAPRSKPLLALQKGLCAVRLQAPASACIATGLGNLKFIRMRVDLHCLYVMTKCIASPSLQQA